MRHLNEFSAREWLELLPLQHAAKQIRNDVWLSLYKSRHPQALDEFLAQTRHLAGKNIAVVIAFEQPWVLNWLLRMANRNLSDTTLLVFDNSRNESKRAEIEQACRRNGTLYFALPPNSTRHVNRSHGMAMTWVYHNVVRAIGPRIFGFLDHDLIPVRKASIADRIADQPLYGLVNVGKFGFWSLWAGYSFFDYAVSREKPINFLYDFSRDLDTGGRNWESLYRHLDRQKLRFATFDYVSTKVPEIEEPRKAQFVDGNWLHLGGMGYGGGTPDRLAFFAGLEKLFDEGR